MSASCAASAASASLPSRRRQTAWMRGWCRRNRSSSARRSPSRAAARSAPSSIGAIIGPDTDLRDRAAVGVGLAARVVSCALLHQHQHVLHHRSPRSTDSVSGELPKSSFDRGAPCVEIGGSGALVGAVDVDDPGAARHVDGQAPRAWASRTRPRVRRRACRRSTATRNRPCARRWSGRRRPRTVPRPRSRQHRCRRGRTN
jgi:hypothetical protein